MRSRDYPEFKEGFLWDGDMRLYMLPAGSGSETIVTALR